MKLSSLLKTVEKCGGRVSATQSSGQVRAYVVHYTSTEGTLKLLLV